MSNSPSPFMFIAMKITLLFLLALLASGCADKVQSQGPEDYTGLIITEVAANADKSAASWVEIYNSSSREIRLAGLGLYLTDAQSTGEEITIMDDVVAKPGQRLVFSTSDMTLLKGLSSDADFKIVLGKSSDADVVDSFSRDADAGASATEKYGSYQRIPENGDDWQVTVQATRRMENFDAKPNGIWVWSTHMDQWIADDFKILKDMKKLGYDHILLNYNSFDDPAKADKARQIIAAAKDAGVKVHAWMQVFCENKTWINPIENLGDGTGRYKQEEFDRIIAKANRYIDEFDVDGIHMDYIRFSGSGQNIANKNNYSNGVTACGAITEFCRQIRASLDTRLEGVILSAAMMTGGNVQYYYGQEASDMGKYIDILMPMVYKYYPNVTYDDSWMRGTCSQFTQASDAQVWAGIQTYTHLPGSQDVKGMGPAEIRADAEVIRSTKCSGVVLFRYALGEFPDVNDLWN